MSRILRAAVFVLLLAMLSTRAARAYWHVNMARLKQMAVLPSSDFGAGDIQAAYALAPEIDSIRRAYVEESLADGDPVAIARLNEAERLAALRLPDPPRWLNLLSVLALHEQAARAGDRQTQSELIAVARSMRLPLVIPALAADQHRAVQALPGLVEQGLWTRKQAQRVVALWFWAGVNRQDLETVLRDLVRREPQDSAWRELLETPGTKVSQSVEDADWRYFEWRGQQDDLAVFRGGPGGTTATTLRIDCLSWNSTATELPYAEFARRFEILPGVIYRLTLRYRSHAVVGGEPFVAVISKQVPAQLLINEPLPGTQGQWREQTWQIADASVARDVDVLLRNSGLGSVEFDQIVFEPISR